MYKDQPEGLYKYGYTEDLDKITPQNLYKYYQDLIQNCKIDIFISGKIENTNIEKILHENNNFNKLQERQPVYNVNTPNKKQGITNENKVEEKMDVTQGKLVIGYDVEIDEQALNNEKFRYIGSLYNAILGGTANSKLFQNVREKASLAYTASSNFAYYTGNILITAGIEIDNFEKAVDIIKQQIEAMKKGDFTDDDIENAKKTMVSNIEGISDEQDTEIIYFLGQELRGKNVSLKKYAEFVNSVNKEEINNFAKRVKINTVYFLRN